MNTYSLVGIRARYLQPYEDHAIGGGVGILNASIENVERADDGSAGDDPADRQLARMTVEADEVIAATGFARRCGTCRRWASRRSARAGCRR